LAPVPNQAHRSSHKDRNFWDRRNRTTPEAKTHNLRVQWTPIP
jgi:hypothetical protein